MLYIQENIDDWGNTEWQVFDGKRLVFSSDDEIEAYEFANNEVEK